MPPEANRQPQSSDPSADNIRAIVELEQRASHDTTWSDRIGDRISAVVGSLWFVLFHVTLFAAWAAWNGLAPERLRFDPYPYALLTFVIAVEGLLIATFVLMAQNRMSRQSDHRDHLDLQVDLLAEQEMTLVLRMLRRISDQLGIPHDDEEIARAEKLTEETDVYQLMERIKQELPEKKHAP